MRKFKIEGVKPFKRFLFRTCYYHQLISALSCFDIDAEYILANAFTFIRDNFEYEDKDIYPEKELLEKLGCKIVKCRIDRRKLCKNIAAGHPVIVGVDCYYLESRADTYKYRHDPHYILAYGYDLDKDEVNVVDHDYVNDWAYKEKTISLGNLLLSDKMFSRGVNNKRHTCRIIEKRGLPVITDIRQIWQNISKSEIVASREASKNNLAKLRKMFFDDTDALKNNIKKIHEYWTSVNRFYKTLAALDMFESEEYSAIIHKLTAACDVLQSAIWKTNAKKIYTFTPEQTEKIGHKLSEIDEYEEKIYAIICRGEL